jgi:hypothetical protein
VCAGLGTPNEKRREREEEEKGRKMLAMWVAKS